MQKAKIQIFEIVFAAKIRQKEDKIQTILLQQFSIFGHKTDLWHTVIAIPPFILNPHSRSLPF